MLRDLRWRLIGPFRGGRVVAVAGDPFHPTIFYFGACSGGIWKTTNAGMTWENVSDGHLRTASVGALEVAPSDPNVIYAGMGEACIRGNVTHGDGVYRSTDAGRTWRHLGLEATRHIGRVRVHPGNPDVAYVAAFGHAFGPNRERGVYRTTDGGKHWDLVLHRDQRTGAIDLAIDATNPRILYATLWEAQRHPHTLVSGGPGSGIFKSTDGGDTWTEITRNPGLPKGVLGRMGIAASPARAGRVYACIEAADGGGLFRSDDGGDTWQNTNDDRLLVIRAWYYEHVIADPVDADTVYVLNIPFLKSVDGGRTFATLDVPHGDNHDLWIDPRNPLRMIAGNDGGACVSLDGGLTWSSLYNQPTAQFYHVTTDSRYPYRIYGAQQDNTTICIPSRSDARPITFGDCYPVGGGESGYIAVRQDDPDVVYAGSYGGLITRYDHRTGQSRDITVWPDDPIGYPAKDVRYRFQWTAPIVLSPHDQGVLYATGNHVFRSRDEGHSWECISPDLTRNDPGKLGSAGGPITQDNVSTEYYCTIFAFAESPVRPGVLWAGSDDGLIHLSRDAGATWANVTPPGSVLPDWALVSIIEPSPHDPAVAYVAATRYKHDDFRPYLLKTADYGATWRLISDGIPDDDFTRVIRADPERRGLLYAGTESGVYVSFDDGGRWERLQGNLPVVPVHDLTVKGSDLVVATHGRSFWILDDLTPLRHYDAATGAGAYLFPPRPADRRLGGGRREGATQNPYGFDRSGGHVVTFTQRAGERRYLDAGENPPGGVVVQYFLKEKPAGEVTLSFLDERGNLIRRFSSAEPKGSAAPTAASGPGGPAGGEGPAEPRPPANPGLCRFVWNMRYPDPTRLPGAVFHGGGATGPVALPGRYVVELAVDGQRLRQTFEIRLDPRCQASPGDLQAQFDLLLQIRDRISAAHDAVLRIRRLRAQAEDWAGRAGDGPLAAALREAAHGLKRRLDPVEEALNQPKVKRHADFLNFPPGLNDKLASLAARVGSADAAPTRQQREVFLDLSARLDAQLRTLDEIMATDVPALNGLVREAGLAPVG
jgi:photosystem II stability/assembly factor-like uncharacterized protein